MNPLEQIIEITTRNLAEAREHLDQFVPVVDGCIMISDGDFLVEYKPIRNGKELSGQYVLLEELEIGRLGVAKDNAQLRRQPWQASLMSKSNACLIAGASPTFHVVKMKDALMRYIKESEELLEMIASKSSSTHQDGPYKGCLRRDANYTVTVNNA